MNVHQSPLPVLIVAVPLLTAFLVPVAGLWRKNWCFALVLIAVGCSTLMAGLIAIEVMRHGAVRYFFGGWEPPWGIEYRIDRLASYMTLVLMAVTLPVTLYSRASLALELPEKIVPVYTLYLLLITALLGIVVTGDMFNLYVFVEIASLAAYALIAVGDRWSAFSAFRYLILGTVGACFYLLGVGYLYSVTGSLNMADLNRLLPALYSSRVALVALAFFVIGLCIKMGLFPMHTWLPGAYTHAPSVVTALIAATMTKVGAYVLMRVLFHVFEPRFVVEALPITTVLAWMGALAMLVGSLLAIAQQDLKRMLAYSSVAQIGYVVLGVGLANARGLTGGLLHMANHALAKGCLFLVAGAILHKTGRRCIVEFAGLSLRMPVTVAAFGVGAFSMIGIPPTCGFFSKLYLILGAVDAGCWTFVAVILLSSVLNLVYFVNVMRHMFFPQEPASVDGAAEIVDPGRDEVPGGMLVAIVSLAAGVVLLGLFNGTIVDHLIRFAVPLNVER